MVTLQEMLAPVLTGDNIQMIAGQVGADEDTTRKVVAVGLPLLVSALARNSTSPEGAQALSSALDRDHDGSALNNLPNTMVNYQAGQGDGILRHVLGDQRQSVEQTLTRSTGVDGGAVLQMLAPVVMGALGSMKRQQGLDASGVATTLQREGQQMQPAGSDVLGMLGTLLDTNKDGSALDDVANIASRFFSKPR